MPNHILGATPVEVSKKEAPKYVSLYIRDELGEFISAVDEDLAYLTEESFNKGYEACKKDAAAGMMNADGIFSGDQVDAVLSAAQVRTLQEFKVALRPFIGMFRFPTEIDKFFQKLVDDKIISEEVNNG